MPEFPIEKLEIRNFRRFDRFVVSFNKDNVLVGPNNSGKSSILDAFRILSSCYRYARTTTPRLAELESTGLSTGYQIPDASIAVPLANAALNFSEDDAILTFSHRNGNRIRIWIHPDRLTRCYLLSESALPRTASAFRRAFPIDLVVIPPLRPLEEQEDLVQDQTINRNISTRLASRYFRNIWYRASQEEFEAFRYMVEEAWPGISVEKPGLQTRPPKLFMFYREPRGDREVFWSGLGFQIWLQILTHFRRSEKGVLLMDEPDIYLHPDLQRKLLHIAQATFGQTILATHSVEIINECNASDLLLINPTHKRARKVGTDDEYQSLLNYLGAADNVEFPRMARAKKIIFFEGQDKKILAALARRKGLLLGERADTLVLQAGGFGQWRRVREVAWTIRNVFRLHAKAICLFDKDYRSEEEMEAFRLSMEAEGIKCLVLQRKELENYLIVTSALARLIKKRMKQRHRPFPPDLDDALAAMISEESALFEHHVQSQLIANKVRYCKDMGDRRDVSDIAREVLERFAEDWENLERRMDVVPGKELLSAVAYRIQQLWGISISPISLATEIKSSEIDDELSGKLDELIAFVDRRS